jgi:uncharacterized membrane protein
MVGADHPKEASVPKATFAEHPAHPQLIPLPVALLPTSLVLDLAQVLTRRRSFADAAYYTLIGAMLGGGAAAVTGAADYLAIPSGSRVKRMATLHGVLNAAILVSTGANLAMRRRDRSSGSDETSAAAEAVLGGGGGER